jgi:hypothetical protein
MPAVADSQRCRCWSIQASTSTSMSKPTMSLNHTEQYKRRTTVSAEQSPVPLLHRLQHRSNPLVALIKRVAGVRFAVSISWQRVVVGWSVGWSVGWLVGWLVGWFLNVRLLELPSAGTWGVGHYPTCSFAARLVRVRGFVTEQAIIRHEYATDLALIAKCFVLVDLIYIIIDLSVSLYFLIFLFRHFFLIV